MGRCEGWAASWCPVCGDCTCVGGENIDYEPGDDPDCPLHGEASEHALEEQEDPAVTAERERIAREIQAKMEAVDYRKGEYGQGLHDGLDVALRVVKGEA